MPVSTDQLFIILLGAGDEERNSYIFCINRSIDDIALSVVRLKNVDGVTDYVKVERNMDDNGDDQTIIEVIFEERPDMPAVFGRIAIFFAGELNVPHDETLLFREVSRGGDHDASPLQFMRLPDFYDRFPSTLNTPELEGLLNEREVLSQLEESLKAS